MVEMTRVNFDRTGDVVDTVVNGVGGVFTIENFIQALNYPFNDTYLIAFEPLRNIYVVERFGRVIVEGVDVPEIQWVADNLQNIANAIPQYSNDAMLDTTLTVFQHRFFLLSSTDWMVVRHSEELLLNKQTTLTSQQFINLTTYRQSLRDLTNQYQPDAPYDSIVWPEFNL